MPAWIDEAKRHLGLREIAGRKHNPMILRMWQSIRAPFTDDETPWCAGFVGHCLEAVGIKSSRSAAARSYLNWGRKLTKPVVGCIVVFERGPRNGHVGFLVGVQRNGNLMILGGNQGDEVNIKAFEKGRVLGYRWPTGHPLPGESLDVSDDELEVSRPEDEGGPTKKRAPEPAEKPAYKKTWLTEGSATTVVATSVDAMSTANTVLGQVKETKQNVSDLGVFDLVLPLFSNPRFVFCAFVALLALALLGFRLWHKWKR